MPESIRLPSDSSNTGKRIRVIEKTVDSITVYDHANSLVDPITEEKARIINYDPTSTDNLGGIITRSIPFGVQSVSGILTHNSSSNGSNNLGVLPALASNNNLSLTDGRQVLLRTNLSGDLVVSGVFRGYDVGVSSLPELPPGTNNIGDIDVLTQPARTHTADSIKIGDGTDLLLISSSGAALVDGSAVTQPISATSLPLPTGASTSAKQDTGNTNLASIDSKITAVNTDAVTISASLPTGTNAIGKLSANSGVDIGDVDITSIAPGDNNIGNVDIVSLPSLVAGSALVGNFGLAQASTTSGQSGPLVQGAVSTNIPSYTDGQTHPLSLTVSGILRTESFQGNQNLFRTTIYGNRDHDEIDAHGPVKVGYRAITSNPAAVSNGDRVNGVADDLGRQVVILNNVRDNETHATANISGTTESTILAGVANVFHDITMIIMTNRAQTSARVDIRDATAGTVILPVFLAGQGGAVIPFSVPLKQTATGGNWTAQSSVLTGDVSIFMQAVKNV